MCFVASSAMADHAFFTDGSLDDWYIVGPQIDFKVEDGVLIGEGKERRNSFLTSKKAYGDFVFTVEVKVIRGNSGIQFARMMSITVWSDIKLKQTRLTVGGLAGSMTKEDAVGFDHQKKMSAIHSTKGNGTSTRSPASVLALKRQSMVKSPRIFSTSWTCPVILVFKFTRVIAK